MATASPSWVLVSRIPRFHDGDVTVDVRSPPDTTTVMLPPHSVDGSIPQGDPYVLAADKTGALLLAFSKPDGGAHPDLAVLTVDEGAATASLRTLPPRRPPVHPVARVTAIGFIATRSSGGEGELEYVVAEIQPDSSSDTERARLITISTQGGGDWIEKELRLPASHARRPWGRDGVLSHAGMIWWSDLSWGLVCCDPLASAPKLVFVELPHGSALGFADHPAVEGRRTLSVSGSRIRYLEVSRVGQGPSRMKLWTLLSDSADGTVWTWKKTGGVRFARIWSGESYAKTRLPARLPILTAISALDPDMVCFQLEDYLVGLHLASNRVGWVGHYVPADLGLHLTSNRVGWVAHHVPADPIAWEIPRCLIPLATGPTSWIIGALGVKGFQCTFIRNSHLSTCMQIQRLHPSAYFSIRFWHKNCPINHIDLVEQFQGSGSIRYSSTADLVPPVIVGSIRDYLLFVPIPDLCRIFKMFRISADSVVEGMDMVESFQPSGRTSLVGSFLNGNERVLFRVHDGSPNPILILECTLQNFATFGIQLMSYIPFYKLTIQMGRGRNCTLTLKVTKDSAELKTSTTDLVCSYVPLPYLPRIARLFR